jgi:hypothetical protein
MQIFLLAASEGMGVGTNKERKREAVGIAPAGKGRQYSSHG